jgi:transposase InsO family protein
LNSNKGAPQQVSPIQIESSDKSQLPAQVKEIIVHYREHNPDHGFKRIEQYLRNTHLLVIPRKQIRKVLKEKGLLEQHDSSFDNSEDSKEPRGTRRFEASKPCELYQMDITYVYIEGLKVLYLIDLIDDHSRFCLSASLRFDQSSDTLIEVLHNAILTFGKPEKLLTDQGTAFYSWSCEKTKFQNYLDDMRIEHIVADPHHPTTTGKVERFHQTIKNELIRKVKFKSYSDAVEKIETFVHHYNYQRPHQSLDGAYPADRFMGVSVSKALARHELLSNDLQHTKGYLVYKLGPHEVSIINRPDQAPQVYVNGVCYIAKNNQVL